ncbi:WecB/TagA/CpsF family glycosyltransferase [Nonomuraea soli]|uniref:N-acetylglucosaminyldiphosphoundecaprenol N-acetyl-beta-D-mannosaminyltransferase n=1 Tax=Nonomuraea soli TaxID=1032476 RepID=A0A7W0CQN1_9ACTN|nr:WecB/TagA/CpsF family glycosyltransferase [Nonomuraea soli]MBA2895566.1 N-acetylglucosaminyldiphosphoundecaprenol N-acetyl-beta-D-mannosaminyltransferase [Nonomuraea soli]
MTPEVQAVSIPRQRTPAPERSSGAGGRVVVAGVAIDPLTETQVVEHVMKALAGGRGGHVITPNVDICRAVAKDASLRKLVRRAELVVADGMPLVWASRLKDRPLPERVTGADLIWSLSKASAREGHPIYLLGGPPGVAAQAAEQLTAYHPKLKVCGFDAPPYGFETTVDGVARVRRRLATARPRVVFVGLGFPKQDLLIAQLRDAHPETWFVGCGAAISFAAGVQSRAPQWMQDSGLEWLFRLACEPGRLARRYLVNDLPFMTAYLARCAWRRYARRS